MPISQFASFKSPISRLAFPGVITMALALWRPRCTEAGLLFFAKSALPLFVCDLVIGDDAILKYLGFEITISRRFTSISAGQTEIGLEYPSKPKESTA
jgi:hypothetical protein